MIPFVRIPIVTFCLTTFLFAMAHAQISGTISDDNGEPLSFATIYIEGSTEGASSNNDGQYELHLKDLGEYTIVCQYVGYASQRKSISYKGQRVRVDFQLQPEIMEVPTVEILGNGEDPAYPIMRKAIAKRKLHQEKIASYTCESYIKGRFDIESVPQMMKAMMAENRMMFDVDSSGRGIVYLSESESTFSKAPPDKVKEVMHSSLISGFDNQFSFNNAMSMDFSIYDADMLMVRHLVSPLAKSAMAYYRFKLLGTTHDQAGNLLNKIEVIPKSATSPTFAGVIYIAEDKWSAPQAELVLTRDHAQEPLIDSVRFVYSSVEVEEDTWVDIKKHIWMRVKTFGFSASGSFNGVFRSYDISPEFEEDYFSRELFAVENESNKKGSVYWDSMRPIPLTAIEELNYQRMDSLKHIRKDRLDSLVKYPPKFKFINAFNGYSRYLKNGLMQWAYTPLNEFGFNSVQGVYWGLGTSLFTNPDSFQRSGFRTGMHLNYSFGEKKIRGGIDAAFLWNNDREEEIGFTAGRYVNQYRQEKPLTDFANSIYTLLDAKNYAKYIEQDALVIEYRRSGLDGVGLRLFTGLARRRALMNNSDRTWDDAGKLLSNNPLDPLNDGLAFESNTSWTIGAEMRIVFGQKYIRYPQRVFKIGSKYPIATVRASYTYNTTIDSDFAHVQVGLSDDYSWKVAGDGQWNAVVGAFLLDKPQYFMDYRHLDGNQTRFGLPTSYTSVFHLLPYYARSTRDNYIEGHYQHHFRGFVMDKIPLIRRLKWNLAAGANYLYTSEAGMYAEAYVGLENIGIHLFRFFRFDLVSAFDDNGKLDTNYIIGIDLGGFLSQRTTHKRQIRTDF